MLKKASLLAIIIALTSISGLKADIQPTTVNVKLSTVYTPVGFDNNDRVQFAVEGVFQNTCYRVGPYGLRVDSSKKTITIQQQAYLYTGVCLQMMVPFTQIINVGLMAEGSYTIQDFQTNKALGTVAISPSKNAGPDDFLYAPVTDAYVVSDTETKKNSLVLTGTFGDRCSELEEIKVLYQNQVLTVQPLMKRVERSCEPVKTRFMKIVELDSNVHGLHMLHVRSLNGQAVNKMVELE